MTGGRTARKKRPFLYKIGILGADWKHAHNREAALMVKGTNRHVVVVRSPDPQVFEEAIFVLKDEYIKGRSAEQVMEEAREAAADYLRKNGAPEDKPARRFVGLIAAAAAALTGGIAWLVLRLIGG